MKTKGLTLKEAVESGRRFRHEWYKSETWEEPDTKVPQGVTWEQIASNDWMIEEKRIEISESEFDEAWKDLTYSQLDETWTKRFEILKQKLFGSDT